MGQLTTFDSLSVPTPVVAAGEHAGVRFLEFFASAIRNPHTRRAYARAAVDFLAWCGGAGAPSIAAVQPLHVAAWSSGRRPRTRRRPSSSSWRRSATCSTGW
ncbi:hypothetical protein WN989_00030 [Burkholderia arboris]